MARTRPDIHQCYSEDSILLLDNQTQAVKMTQTVELGTGSRTGLEWNITLPEETEEGAGGAPENSGKVTEERAGKGTGTGPFESGERADGENEGNTSVVVTHGETVINSTYSVDQLINGINDTHWKENETQPNVMQEKNESRNGSVKAEVTEGEALQTLEPVLNELEDNTWKTVNQSLNELEYHPDKQKNNTFTQTPPNPFWESTDQKHINDSIKLMASANSEAEIVGESGKKTVAKREVWPSHVAREQEGGMEIQAKAILGPGSLLTGTMLSLLAGLCLAVLLIAVALVYRDKKKFHLDSLEKLVHHYMAKCRMRKTSQQSEFPSPFQVVIESSPVPSPAYTPVAYSTYRKIGSPIPPYSNYLADVGPRKRSLDKEG